MKRIQRLTAICAALTAAVVSHNAHSQSADNYPTKSIRVIVPLAAGGPSDTMARILAAKLTEVIGQTVLVDNRPGASGIVGTEMTVRAPADGYTIALVSNTISLNPAVFRKLPYDTERDVTPVSLLAATPYLLSVHPSLPVRSVKELIALAKARPGELNHGSAGAGTGPHLAMEVFAYRAGIKVVQIIYKGGGPALNDFVGGHTQVFMSNMVTTLPQHRAGRIRGIAISKQMRSKAAPDMPTIHETGMTGFDEGGQHGLVGPAGIPKPILDKLYASVATAMRSPEVTRRLADDGSEAVASTPDEYRALIRRETAKWTKIVAVTGIPRQ
jgi:tripartite-type tricarboxylate transporter receptor subunit TctC